MLEVDGLHFSYGDFHALKGLDLDVPQGRIGLVGANGAGKTTLVRVLLGLAPASAGTARVLGHDVAIEPDLVQARVGFMPEGNCLPLEETAAKFVSYAGELGGLPPGVARQRAADTLTIVGLDEERFRPIGTFSTGMTQRTKLAQAIVHSPELVFLDEPTSGLDPNGRADMLALIKRLGDFGISVVFSTHVLTDIEATCDWVIMMDQGRILRSGPLDAVQSGHRVIAEFLDQAEPAVASLRAQGFEVEVNGRHVAIEPTQDMDGFQAVMVAAAEYGLGLRSLSADRRTLEQLFLEEESAERGAP
ncbi:MAG: ABC transporter ATP-binding protein [Acidimicrobiia bacterium]|nr:ABC transporter ATP-binding protein [Acidimicrobiia bacterium]